VLLYDFCEKAYFIPFSLIRECERITLQEDVLEAEQINMFLIPSQSNIFTKFSQTPINLFVVENHDSC
jgi:hypothetical protein